MLLGLYKHVIHQQLLGTNIPGHVMRDEIDIVSNLTATVALTCTFSGSVPGQCLPPPLGIGSNVIVDWFLELSQHGFAYCLTHLN